MTASDTSVSPEQVDDMIERSIQSLRAVYGIPDGKPCDEIDRVVSAGVNYIVVGRIVDDPVYHPITGFVYGSEDIKQLVLEFAKGLVKDIVQLPLTDEIMDRLIRFAGPAHV